MATFVGVLQVVAVLLAGAAAYGDETPRPVTDARFPQQVALHQKVQAGLPSTDVREIALDGDRVIAITAGGATAWIGKRWESCEQPAERPLQLPPGAVRCVAVGAGGLSAAATSEGLYERSLDGPWNRLLAEDDQGLIWTSSSVQALTYDQLNRLWCATPAGIAVRSDDGWRFFKADQLPVNEFTCAAASVDGVVWFGSRRGAVSFDRERWSYRQGPRWLPDDDIRAMAIDDDGAVWLATAAGVGCVETRRMTLAEKAAHYEREIAEHIARTPYGFVSGARLSSPGDRSTTTPGDDDNDGLWTAMYGAAQCFAYAVDHSVESKKRAMRAFEALRFLQEVTQGGEHSPPVGFVARSVLPTSGPDPNNGRLEADRRTQASDRMWKVIDPRWPLSADGHWWWKCDTSSDELDGHYFFYALYYDLVAESADEREAVREVVRRLTNHLITHRFALVDHDGAPTRWAVFGPTELNNDARWSAERGLNSMSILSFLAVAEHVTGDARYAAVAAELRDEHAYHTNVANPKWQRGVASGNQSDDEMAFMSFYNLIRLTEDEQLRSRYLAAFYSYWRLEAPERNPLFNFLYAAVGSDATIETTFGPCSLSPDGAWLSDSVDTLRRLPLDRINWPHANGHRLDVRPLASTATVDPFDPTPSGRPQRGSLRDGSPVPVDERTFDHWNHDPWRLDTVGDGKTLAPGTTFLLPYYLGRFHGYID